MNAQIQLRKATQLFIVVVCFAFSPAVRAVSPPPDGGYLGNNTAEGDNALFNLTQGDVDNTAVGYDALSGTPRRGVGDFNTAVGVSALMNTYGGENTAAGAFALMNNVNGGANTATGFVALEFNTIGDFNTATGSGALSRNTSGGNNTANGSLALIYNTTGSFNTATGANALYSLTSGSNNTATGVRALGGEFILNTGSFNTATAVDALNKNTTGSRNTANGVQALFNNTTGFKNSAMGVSSLSYNTTGNDNVAIGIAALQNNTTGSFNIAVGSNAGANVTTGRNNIIIGPPGRTDDTNTIRIGAPTKQNATYIAGIFGAGVPGGVGVIIDSSGHLGTVVSSERFKDDIKPMDNASEAILALKPVTFRYKKDIDPDGVPQFGLVAEDVEKVNPDLVVRDANGKAYTVRYEAVSAMLLNEFLKAHRRMEDQEGTIAKQQKQIDALAASLQRVSAQLELTKCAPQTVLNNH